MICRHWCTTPDLTLKDLTTGKDLPNTDLHARVSAAGFDAFLAIEQRRS
jgi:hypothetical protein